MNCGGMPLCGGDASLIVAELGYVIVLGLVSLAFFFV
jgi:hypothetical protein